VCTDASRLEMQDRLIARDAAYSIGGQRAGPSPSGSLRAFLKKKIGMAYVHGIQDAWAEIKWNPLEITRRADRRCVLQAAEITNRTIRVKCEQMEWTEFPRSFMYQKTMYTKETRVDQSVRRRGTIGLRDYAQQRLGRLVFVDLRGGRKLRR